MKSCYGKSAPAKTILRGELFHVGSLHALVSDMRMTLMIACFVVAIGCRTTEVPEQQVSDAEITARLKAQLVENVGAATVTNISVNATNGVVTLAGTVHNPAEESKVVAIARATPKVARVNDNLQVMPVSSP
jgi:hypothetical protein